MEPKRYVILSTETCQVSKMLVSFIPCVQYAQSVHIIVDFIIKLYYYYYYYMIINDCLCGLVVRVLDLRSGGPGPIPGTTRKKNKVVGLEWGPLSLVSTTEELLDRKVAAPV
jgi:hypothetical protein